MQNGTSEYLVFAVQDELYGVPIAKVQEVIRYIPVTTMHEVSPFMKGVVNLRGRIIPIIDMRLKFGLPEKEYTDRTVFVIADVEGRKDTARIGLAVDGVREVAQFDDAAVNRTPEIGFKFKTQYLHGIVHHHGTMVMVLDLDAVLTSQEIVALGEQESI